MLACNLHNVNYFPPCMALRKVIKNITMVGPGLFFALKEMARLMRIYHRKYKECINQEVVVKTRPFTMTDLSVTGYGKSVGMTMYAQNDKISTFKLSKDVGRDITKSVH